MKLQRYNRKCVYFLFVQAIKFVSLFDSVGKNLLPNLTLIYYLEMICCAVGREYIHKMENFIFYLVMASVSFLN